MSLPDKDYINPKIIKAWLEGDWKVQDFSYKNNNVVHPIAYVDDLKIFTDAGYELFKDNAGVDFVIVQGVRVYLYQGVK